MYVDPTWNIFGVTSGITAYGSLRVTITLQSTAITSITGTLNLNSWASGGSSSENGVATSTDQSGNTYTTQTSIADEGASVPYDIGYHFNSASSSWSYSDVTSFNVVTENEQYATNAVYNGVTEAVPYTFTGAVSVESITFIPEATPNLALISGGGYTVEYYISNIEQAQSTSTTQTFTGAQNPTQQQNWWNSTLSLTLTDPSGALNNPSLSTTSGTIDAETTMTWSINHILSVGYGQSPAFDRIFYSGSDISSSSFAPSAEYNSVSQGTAVVVDSSSAVSYNFDEFINYHPSIVNSNVATPVNPLTPLDLYANSTEVILGEQQNLAVSANGKPYIHSSPTSSESLASPSFYFHSTGQKIIDWYVHNDPNGNPYPGSELNSSTQSATVNVVPFSLTPSPVDYSSVGTSVLMSLAYSTQTSAKMTIINLTVNGVLEDRFHPDLTSGTVKYDFTQPVSAPLLVTWQAVDQYGYSQSITFQYGSNLTPTEYSNKVTVLQSANATHSYPITISSPPSGTGDYQQLITLSPSTTGHVPSYYGINSQASNFQIALPNGTLLYTWIQNFNSTSLTMWVKMPYGTSQVELQVLPSFENVLSATGYVGKSNSTSSNYYLVFQNMSISEQQSQGNTVISWMNTPDNGQTDTLPDGTTGYREVLTTDASITRPQYSFYKIPFAGSIQVSGWELIPNSNAFYVVSPTETPSLPANNPGAYVIAGTQGYTGYSFQLYSNQTLLNSQYYAPSTWQYFTFTYYQNNGSGIFTEGNDPGSIVKSYSFSTSFTNESYIGIGEWGGETGGSGGASNYYHTKIAYWGAGSMPTYTIGTGSVFQANATTTSTFSGAPTGNYNATYVYDTYNIPIAPSTNYVTVTFNSTWRLSNIYPSTYLPLQNSNFVTIEDVTGFTSVQVTLIEPSSQIGSTTYQSIDYQMPSGITPPVNYFTNTITITPFASSSQTTEKTTAQFVQIPYGSSISIDVTDPWGDSVGSISNYVVANTTGSITIPLDVTELQFSFFNSTENYVYLSHNGINESFYNSAIVANDTTFQWFTSYYSITSGQEQGKSGTVTTDEPIQPLLIYLKAPAGQLQVEVNAYNGSNLGTLSNSGNPRVLSFIDGTPYTLGSTFTGYQGSTYTIRIADLLNQTLLETNVTLQSSFTSLTEMITTPSYWMGIENDEQVPQNSPLATEYVSLNQTGSSHHYNFTDSVGQNWQGYFLAGNYTIHMHDNVTNTFFVNISTSNQQFYLNGQALLNLTDFDKKINQLLNYTESVQNTTYGLRLVPSSSSVSVLTDQVASFSWDVYYQNYTSFPTSDLKNSTIFVQIRNSTGSVQSFAASTSASGNTVTYTTTPTTTGYFTVGVDVLYGKYAGSSSQSLQVSAPQKVSVGMSVAFGITQSLDTNKSYVVPLYMLYGNGTRFNLTDTADAFPYTTLYVLQGNTVIHTYAPVNYSAGTIDFNIAPLGTGQYTFYASVSQFNLSGTPVHAAITQTENVQPASLSALGEFEAFWEQIGHGLATNLLYTILGTLAVLAGAWGIRKIIKWLRGDKATNTKITDYILSNAVQKLQRPYDNLPQTLAVFTSLEYSEQNAFLLASHEVLRLREVTIGGKKSSLEKVRDYIVKVKRQPDGESLLARIEKKFASGSGKK
jgi:hypothetical protein